MLLDAVPDLAMSGKPRTPIAGEVPNPLAPPPGCAFHPRCPHANERCRRERPQVIDNVACHAVEEGRIDLAAQAVQTDSIRPSGL
jgi:peptide/nickel transport system ATP-binding protein